MDVVVAIESSHKNFTLLVSLPYGWVRQGRGRPSTDQVPRGDQEDFLPLACRSGREGPPKRTARGWAFEVPGRTLVHERPLRTTGCPSNAGLRLRHENFRLIRVGTPKPLVGLYPKHVFVSSGKILLQSSFPLGSGRLNVREPHTPKNTQDSHYLFRDLYDPRVAHDVAQ